MRELERLGEELRRELGEPPVDWALQQRRRLRTARIDRRLPLPSPRLALALIFAGTLAAASIWLTARPSAETAPNASSANIWLDAETSAVPYRAPDGSSIRLAAGSQGRFSSDASSAVFDLHHGRGHFEVMRRPHQDFRVVAGVYEVRVIGTRFSVNYDAARNLDVTVEAGRVSVRAPQRSEPVLLEAGDRLSIRGQELSLRAHGSHGMAAPTARDVAAAELDPGAARAVGEESTAPAPSPATSPVDTKSADPDWHVLYQRGEYRAALKLAKAQGFAHLTQTLAAQRLIELADAARLGGDSEAALLALRALELRFPSSAASADAGFLIGRLHAQRGESAAAVQRLTAYLERGDGARYSLEATGRLMELHAASGNQPQARALAHRYLQRAPKGPYQRLATSVLDQK